MALDLSVSPMMRNLSGQPMGAYGTQYTGRQFGNCDFIFDQWLKNERIRNLEKSKHQDYGASASTVPMVINHGQQPGNVTFISPYHNIIPQQNTQPQQQYITENGIVNLRKSQFDGEEDDSSDDDKNDFITVGQDMEPQFIKNEEDPDDDEDLESSMPDVIAKDTPKPQEESSSDDNDNDVEDQEEEPLNTDDDISDDDPEKIFDCDNVIVCQFDKVNRTRNKWKLNFVSGIANLEGRDSVFHKAVGEAEW